MFFYSAYSALVANKWVNDIICLVPSSPVVETEATHRIKGTNYNRAIGRGNNRYTNMAQTRAISQSADAVHIVQYIKHITEAPPLFSSPNIQWLHASRWPPMKRRAMPQSSEDVHVYKGKSPPRQDVVVLRAASSSGESIQPVVCRAAENEASWLCTQDRIASLGP